jgi:hypothetical protein
MHTMNKLQVVRRKIRRDGRNESQSPEEEGWWLMVF